LGRILIDIFHIKIIINFMKTKNIPTDIKSKSLNETKSEIKDILNKSPMMAYENDNLQVAHERMKEARLQSLVVRNNDEKIVGVIQIFK